MSIIDEADNFQWKETTNRIAGTLREIGYNNQSLAFYELLRFFDITSVDKLKDPENLRKAETIFEHFKDSEDILDDLRRLSSQLGNPVELGEKLNKIYSFVYSENLERGFKKEKETQDTELAKSVSEKQKEKEAAKKKRLKDERAEQAQEVIKKQAVKRDKAREKLLQKKQEKELSERMETIRRTKSPKEPELPDVKI